MDPAAVAAFYQAKGYRVQEGVRASGLSGQEHRVPLMAEGPLGSLAIFFGDFAGVDGPEMGGARKVARDLGATPVLAADSFSNQDRQVAARLGVVLLDADALEPEASPAAAPSSWPGLQARAVPPDEPEPHPWPASGRVGGRDGPPAQAVDVDDLLAAPRAHPPAPTADEPPPGDGAGLWSRPRSPAREAAKPARAAGPRFGWLGIDVPPETPGPLAVDYEDVVPARIAARGAAGIGQVPLMEPGEAIRADARRLRKRLLWFLVAALAVYLLWLLLRA